MTEISINSLLSPITCTWCPGCGNFLILHAIKQALIELKLDESQVVFVYGIGCAGNGADFSRCHGFHALHGRALANAVGIKLANHKLHVIVLAGDGDIYGEGLNHLIEACRGNHDLTLLVHNNGRYSLTTGQAAPTTAKGIKTKSTPTGLIEQPLNPLLMALSAGATFVARGYSTQPAQLTQMFKEALLHPGFSLIDVLQLCPTFNPEMGHQWFVPRIYQLSDVGHDPSNIDHAFKEARVTEKYPLGIVYQNEQSVPYHAEVPQLQENPLLNQQQQTVSTKEAWRKMV